MFSDSLIQAVNDWQRGGDATQKKRRGLALRTECKSLPEQFRRTALCCFRQISLQAKFVWELHDRLCLAETISSWTLTTDVAREFKGGVPPEGIPGAIFDIVPPAGSVVVNLDALYRDEAFVSAHSGAKSRIKGYHYGIGKYGNSQHEVVLEIESVPLSSVYALGGHSSGREDFAQFYFGRQPTTEEQGELDALMKASGAQLGPGWLVGAAKDRVLTKTLQAHGIIKARSIAQSKPLP